MQSNVMHILIPVYCVCRVLRMLPCFVLCVCLFCLLCSYVGQWEMNKKQGKGRFEYASGEWEAGCVCVVVGGVVTTLMSAVIDTRLICYSVFALCAVRV